MTVKTSEWLPLEAEPLIKMQVRGQWILEAVDDRREPPERWVAAKEA